jgi:hypothetical protein
MSGRVIVTGLAAQALLTVTQSASGTVINGLTASANQTLDPLAQTASGKAPVTATTTQALEGLTQNASGNLSALPNGHADQTLDDLAQIAGGTTDRIASADQTLEDLGQNARGDLTPTEEQERDQWSTHFIETRQKRRRRDELRRGSVATAAQVLEGITVLARGKIIQPVKGRQQAILEDMWSSAAGEVDVWISGRANQVLDGISSVSSGRVLSFQEERDRLKQDLEDIMDIMAMLAA